MSRLILPKVWTQQPQQAVVSPRDGLPALLPSLGFTTHNGLSVVQSGSVGRSVRGSGIGYSFAGSALARASMPTSKIGTVDGVGAALLAVFSTTSTTTDARFATLGTDQGSTGNSIFSIGQGSTSAANLRITVGGSGGNYGYDASGTVINDGKLHCAVLSFSKFSNSANGAVSLYLDGRPVVVDWVAGVTGIGTTFNYLVAGGFRRGGADSPSFSGDVFLVRPFEKALSNAEALSLSANPWRVFKAPDARIWVPVSPGGGITIAPGTGHAVLAGKTATIAQPNTVAPSAAHVALTGHAPTVSQSAAIVVNPGAGHVALTGSVPGISQPRTVAPGVGHALLAGKPPIIVQAITLAPGSGHAVVAGKSPGVSQSSGMTLFPGIAHAVLAGKTPGIAQPNNIAPNTGHAVFAGKAPAVDSSAPLTDAEKIALILQILENRQTLNPVTGLFTLYADDGTTVLKTAQAWEDTAATIPYRGQGLQRLDALQ